MAPRLIVLTLIMVGLLGVTFFLRSSHVDSHTLMVEFLEGVKARTPVENKFLGTADLVKLDEQLAAATSQAERINVLWERSPVLLRLGKTDEALLDLQEVAQLSGGIGQQLSPEEFKIFEIELQYNLGLTNLRKGETENCVFCRTGESCILPIQGEGVHKKRMGSEQALPHLMRVLELKPDHLSARWLLNVAHMTLGTYPDKVPAEFLIDPKRFSSGVEFPRFPNLSKDIGLDAMGLAGGVATDDFDGDGLIDVITSDWDTSKELKYFKNMGDGTFKQRGDEAGFHGIYGGLNLRHVDYDNDGDLDLFVLRGGWMDPETTCVNSLLANDGKGVFRDVTFDVGLVSPNHQTQTAEWADFDNDGWLDVYIGNENNANQLFRSDGRGHFVDVAVQAGVDDPEYTKGVNWGDYDGDSCPDLYVSNLGAVNRLYHNNRDGTFTDVAGKCGVDQPMQSFPVWFWDYNNDGALDIYVSGYDLRQGVESFAADFLELPHQADRDYLYQGDGRGNFKDVAKEQGIARVTLPMGSNFGDIDGDGFLDYYLGTGYTSYDALVPNRAFLNQGGKKFVDVSMAAGLSHLQKGHGVSIVDIDADGDNDIFIVIGGAFPGDGFTSALFQNPGMGNRYLKVKLVGTKTNRCAIGAKIKLTIEEKGATRDIYRWINTGGSFGGNPFQQTIGLGQADRIKSLEVTWPKTAQSQTLTEVSLDSSIEIVEH